jgi:hypothetical protein
MDKEFKYINNFYGKKFKAGLKARALGKEGVLAYGDNYVYLFFGKQVSAPFHPNDVELVEETNYKKSEWGDEQFWGILKLRYKPTGEIKELKLGIRRMAYHNELIFCDTWGYDKGSPTDLNHPDNYEVVSVEENI